MYDPTVGRFISEDPIGFSAGDASLNRYVGNSPTNATDPQGEFIWFVFFAVAVAYTLTPDTANAPAPGDPLIPSDKDSPLLSGALAGVAAGAGRIVKMVVDQARAVAKQEKAKKKENYDPWKDNRTREQIEQAQADRRRENFDLEQERLDNMPEPSEPAKGPEEPYTPDPTDVHSDVPGPEETPPSGIDLGGGPKQFEFATSGLMSTLELLDTRSGLRHRRRG